jgi:prophage regulatory protein
MSFPLQYPQNRAQRRRFLRYKAVVERTGLCKRTIENLIRDGLFVEPVKIGVRAVGFVEEEVDAWVDSRIAARDNAVASRNEAQA